MIPGAFANLPLVWVLGVSGCRVGEARVQDTEERARRSNNPVWGGRIETILVIFLGFTVWGLSNFHLRLSDWPSLATRASRGRDEGWRRPVRRLRSPPSLRRGWVTPGACGPGEGGEQPGGRRAPCQAHRSHADELDPSNRRPSSRVTRPSVETTERRRQRQEQTEDRRQGRSRTLRNPFEDVNLQKVSSSILD